MSKETTKGGAPGKDPGKAKPKRKLTREEKKQIAAIIRQAKGDGKAHTAQQTIPYINLYPDGICRVTERKYSKSINALALCLWSFGGTGTLARYPFFYGFLRIVRAEGFQTGKPFLPRCAA